MARRLKALAGVSIMAVGRSAYSYQFLLLLAACAGAAPASAQMNLVGYWNPLFHEDVDERIPGPSIRVRSPPLVPLGATQRRCHASQRPNRRFAPGVSRVRPCRSPTLRIDSPCVG